MSPPRLNSPEEDDVSTSFSFPSYSFNRKEVATDTMILLPKVTAPTQVVTTQLQEETSASQNICSETKFHIKHASSKYFVFVVITCICMTGSFLLSNCFIFKAFSSDKTRIQQLSATEALARIEEDLRLAQVRLQAEIDEQQMILEGAIVRMMFLEEQKLHTVVLKPKSTAPDAKYSTWEETKTEVIRDIDDIFKDSLNDATGQAKCLTEHYSCWSEMKVVIEKLLPKVKVQTSKTIEALFLKGKSLENEAKQWKSEALKRSDHMEERVEQKVNIFIGRVLTVFLVLGQGTLLWWLFCGLGRKQKI